MVSTNAMDAALRSVAPDLLAYFERRVTNREDAADLLGETFLQAWTRKDSFPANAEGQRMWLFTIAGHVLANHRRSSGRRLALVDKLRSALLTVGPDPDIGDEAALRDAVRSMSPTRRELVMLIHWDGFTIAAAAELLGINPSTARSRYAGARAELLRLTGSHEGKGAPESVRS
jgi:RNA polymerase sigma-70 factor (ECF subfamily)